MRITLEGIVCSPESFTEQELLERIGQLPWCRVWLGSGGKDEKELLVAESRRILPITPAGFTWGVYESGCYQLAFSICVELFGDSRARCLYQAFMETFLVSIARNVDFCQTIDLTDFITEHLDCF